RLRDEEGSVLWVRFNESTNGAGQDTSTFSLLDDAGNVVGTGTAGSNVVLQTSTAAFYLAQTNFVGTGPTGPSVTVNFNVSFKAPAAGRVYNLELLATDDAQNMQGPDIVGTWAVNGSGLYLPLLIK